MKQNYYILSEGVLVRKENTVYFIARNKKVPIPVKKIYAIYAMMPLTLSSGVIHFLAQNRIPIFFFNYYGFYDGVFYPREQIQSGLSIVNQVKTYLDYNKRIYIAKKFISGAAKNMIRNMERYKLSDHEDQINKLIEELNEVKSITELMNVEARIRQIYYDGLDQILPDDFKIVKRTRRPPQNEGNALMSFGNSLLYATTLSEIYHTSLHPTISFLHEPSERRFSLALDISEIFKPLLVDRLIIYLVKKKIIQVDDFRKEFNGVLLKEKGKKKFVRYYDERLKKKIKHRKLNRNVSYQHLIRLECYKLMKYILGVSERYDPFVIWW